MRLLFVCSRANRRSLTAEKLFDGRNGMTARSAGTETGARIKVTAGDIRRADIVFCMEKKHVSRLKEKFNDELSGKKVICLNIPDEYGFMDEQLCDILESCVPEYL